MKLTSIRFYETNSTHRKWCNFKGERKVSQNPFSASDTSRTFPSIPRFGALHALHTDKIQRDLSCTISKQFYLSNCGLLRAISQQISDFQVTAPDFKAILLTIKQATWGKFSYHGLKCFVSVKIREEKPKNTVNGSFSFKVASLALTKIFALNVVLSFTLMLIDLNVLNRKFINSF